jgi:K+-sensing histidine kinase KdpD
MHMNQQSESRRERVVVALDASANSRATLRAAAQLALQLQAELEGLFIEDDNLLRLCNLPFSQEVGLFSATARRLDSGAIEREFRGVARSLQQLIASIAEHSC